MNNKIMLIKVTNENCGSGLREISLYDCSNKKVELIARGVEKRNKKEWYSGLVIGFREFSDSTVIPLSANCIIYYNVDRKKVIEIFINHDFFIDEVNICSLIVEEPQS